MRVALKDAFSDLDYSGNGAIRAHDVGTALRAIGQTPTEADIQELLQDAMLDGQYTCPQNGAKLFSSEVRQMATNCDNF